MQVARITVDEMSPEQIEESLTACVESLKRDGQRIVSVTPIVRDGQTVSLILLIGQQ